MGTRSTITFCEKIDDKIIPYVNIYQQYDGYLEGVGKELCEWLEDKIIVNGFSPGDRRDIANGVTRKMALEIFTYTRLGRAMVIAITITQS